MPFPTELTNAVDDVTEIVAAQLNNLEAKVGIDGSAVVTSLDYLLKNAASIDPGHKHSKLWASDGSLAAMTVDATGKIMVGSGTPAARLHLAETITTSPRGIISAQYNTGTEGARLHLRKARGSLVSPTVVVSGDMLGRLVASGYDGSNYLEMAGIDINCEGTIGSTRIPTRISFWTATDAAPSVLTERMRINSAGNVGIGTTAPYSKLFIANGELMVDYGTGGSTNGAAFRFYSNLASAYFGSNQYYTDAVRYARAGGAHIITFDISTGATAGDIAFKTAPSGAADAAISFTERMRITQGGNVGIGATSPNATALLHLASTSKGFLPPVMTTTQKNAISTPPAGLVVYDSTLGKLCVRGASAWETITSI